MVPELSHQIVAEDNCLIVLGVSRAIQKRHGLFRRGVQYRLPACSIVIQFVFIASPEFAPALGVVPEPIAKFIARRYLLEPAVEAQRFLLLPWPMDAQTRLRPSAVVTRSFALEVQVGAMPGQPGAAPETSTARVFMSKSRRKALHRERRLHVTIKRRDRATLAVRPARRYR